MFRAAALFLVMALTAGPNVSWVCAVVCDRAQPSSSCRHDEPAASVIAAADTCCEIAAPGVAGFVPRDARHSGVSVDSNHSSPVQRSTIGDSLTEVRRDTGQAPASAQDRHSLSAALRL